MSDKTAQAILITGVLGTVAGIVFNFFDGEDE